MVALSDRNYQELAVVPKWPRIRDLAVKWGNNLSIGTCRNGYPLRPGAALPAAIRANDRSRHRWPDETPGVREAPGGGHGRGRGGRAQDGDLALLLAGGGGHDPRRLLGLRLGTRFRPGRGQALGRLV